MRRATAIAAGGAALAACTVLLTSAGHPAPGPRSGGPVTTISVHPDIQYPSHRRVAGPGPGAYAPSQLRAAYSLGKLQRTGIDGRGQTIVIVDSFGSPTIRHDLAVFDRTFHLPAPPSLKIIAPAGRIPRFNPSDGNMTGWAGETSLDVEWAHAMAPAARIVLAATPVSENEGRSGFPQIVTAEKYVLSHHLGGVISQSFSATEQTFPGQPSLRALSGLRAAYFLAAKPRYRVTVLTASGDSGATDYQANLNQLYTHPVTSWPDSDPLVTGVGGTDLTLNQAGQRAAPDAVWGQGSEGGGGGRSVFFSTPAFQHGLPFVSGRRGVPDVSMSAACDHAVWVYQSYPGTPPGWYTVCGTSEATPLFAGIIALAGQKAGHPLGNINPLLYRLAAQHAPGIVDITHGSNTVSFSQNGRNHTVSVTGGTAVPGYDLGSGVGTIDASKFVPELAALANGH
jgi:subtilase family serine protease